MDGGTSCTVTCGSGAGRQTWHVPSRVIRSRQDVPRGCAVPRIFWVAVSSCPCRWGRRGRGGGGKGASMYPASCRRERDICSCRCCFITRRRGHEQLGECSGPRQGFGLAAVHAHRTMCGPPLQLCAKRASLLEVLRLLGHTLDYRWGGRPASRNVSALGRCRREREGGWFSPVPAAHVVHLSPPRELQHRRLPLLQGGPRV